jgi:hypothetical protein
MIAISFALGLRQRPETTTAWHFTHGHRSEAHNHRPACVRTGLAALRRSSLVVQKIYRLAVGIANDWRGASMTKTVVAVSFIHSGDCGCGRHTDVHSPLP